MENNGNVEPLGKINSWFNPLRYEMVYKLFITLLLSFQLTSFFSGVAGAPGPSPQAKDWVSFARYFPVLWLLFHSFKNLNFVGWTCFNTTLEMKIAI